MSDNKMFCETINYGPGADRELLYRTATRHLVWQIAKEGYWPAGPIERTELTPRFIGQPFHPPEGVSVLLVAVEAAPRT